MAPAIPHVAKLTGCPPSGSVPVHSPGGKIYRLMVSCRGGKAVSGSEEKFRRSDVRDRRGIADEPRICEGRRQGHTGRAP
jgi:hypothetical protein